MGMSAVRTRKTLRRTSGGVVTNVIVEAETTGVAEAACAVVRRAIEAALHHLSAEDSEVSVVICDDARIHELNQEWRGVDAPTDVLSFPLEEIGDDEPGRELAEDEPRLLGDIVISWPRAMAQAEEYGHSVEREMAFLAVHGTLHLLGFDHMEEEERAEMRVQEEEILKLLGLER